jgi:hypothetical protein
MGDESDRDTSLDPMVVLIPDRTHFQCVLRDFIPAPRLRAEFIATIGACCGLIILQLLIPRT